MNGELKISVICLLEEVLRDPDLLPQERKATANILRYSTHTNIHNHMHTQTCSMCVKHLNINDSLCHQIVLYLLLNYHDLNLILFYYILFSSPLVVAFLRTIRTTLS